VINISQSQETDSNAIDKVLLKAFKNHPFSDQGECELVARIKNSADYKPELSLVAKDEQNRVIGYILLTPLKIVSDKDQLQYTGLVMAPLAVLPSHQNKGIGTQLIKTAQQAAQNLNFPYILLLGPHEYFSKFNYETCVSQDVGFHFHVPEKYALIKELIPNTLEQINGMVHYPEAFF
jgi:predicted N-acetyltransferase YhbS